MSTTTFDLRSSDTLGTADKPAKPSFFQRLIDSRMRQGRSRVAAHLAASSNDTPTGLASHTEPIAQNHKTGHLPTSF